MRITLPIGKGIPLDIAEEKIPGLIEKVIPTAMKHMDSLKTMGVDLTPVIRKMFGAAEPAVSAPSSTPATDPAVELEALKKQGYWQHSDGRLYPPDLIARPAAATPITAPLPGQTASKTCSNCLRGNVATGAPLSPFNPPCNTCQFDISKGSWMQRS